MAKTKTAMKPRALKITRVRTEYPLTTEVLELSQAARAAHCLNYIAKKYPYQWVYWNWLYQLIQGQKRTPTLKSRDVELLRARSSDIRRLCQEKYKMTVTLSRELSAIRACVDSQDILDSGEMEKHVEAVDAATRSMTKTGGLVDSRKLKNDNVKHRRLREFFNLQVSPAMRSFESSKFKRRMLTPRREARIEDKAAAKAANKATQAAKKKS